MNTALQQLKVLLLSYSTRSFDVHQCTSIVNTLQSFLKVAEMRNRCCFIDDCAHPTLAQKNKFSLHMSIENDRLLIPAAKAGSNNEATDYDGQSDEESGSDSSYETAEDGYEVISINNSVQLIKN